MQRNAGDLDRLQSAVLQAEVLTISVKQTYIVVAPYVLATDHCMLHDNVKTACVWILLPLHIA